MAKNHKQALDYQSAGVNIQAGNALVDSIKSLTAATKRAGADAKIGGFSGILDLKAAGFHDPLILAATDGVGTKLKMAIDYQYHQGIGIDLVAMCANDLIVQGATPLAFLDYYATGKLDVKQAKAIIASIAHGCMQANMALIGGETAEMPGLYGDGDYDLAGFAIGAVERNQLLEQGLVKDGDFVLGLKSTGPHANGYSLIRKILAVNEIDARQDDKDFLNMFDKAHCEEAHGKEAHDKGHSHHEQQDSHCGLIDFLMAPTRIYVPTILKLLAEFPNQIHGLCHITGGGFYENLPRIISDDLQIWIDPNSWHRPFIFDWLQEKGNINPREMMRVFNCGIGMTIIIPPSIKDKVLKSLDRLGEKAAIIGHVKKKESDQALQVIINGIDN